MTAGTFVLSMFVQTRYDYADRHKKYTTPDKANADELDLRTELKEVMAKAGAERQYEMIPVPIRR